jgi:hypothetical protein
MMHHGQNAEHSQALSSFSQGGQALVPVSEGQENECKEKITMAELVVKGCVLETLDPVDELVSQFGDFFELIQDDLTEDGIDLLCSLAEGNKTARQKAHDMARHLSKLAKHTGKMRTKFMDAPFVQY